MKFDGEDNGNCRVYYRDGGSVYCYQNEGAWGKNDFRFYFCSRDGEPSHEVKPPADLPRPPGVEAVGRELNEWLNTEKGKA